MNAPATVQQGQSRALTPIKEFQEQVEQREQAFASSLPAHIPMERFKRVVLRAVQKDPNLLNADRVSLLSAAMDAANDGLLPDGREGAMVVYNTKQGNGWIKKVQWMPMIFGILKKVRNSGELKALSVRIVYGGDQFRHWIDENGEHLHYEAADNPDKSIFRRAFAQALTNSGGVYLEVMDAEDIEKVRNVSRAKDKGPWVDWFEEMAKKTVLRRLAKRLPMSTDLDDLMRRDDALYDMEGAKDRRQVEAPRMLSDRLDALADMRGTDIDHDGGTEDVDPDPSAAVDEAPANEKAEPAKAEKPKPETESGPEPQAAPDGDAGNGAGSVETPSSGSPAPDNPAPDDGNLSEAHARAAGAEHRAKGMARKAVPAQFRKEPLLTAFHDGFDTGVAEDREPGSDG
ncbi:recombinase RecT [Mesorhizobium sp. Z1-4]|uniref:recombinase RecT n=1 Tax=Mesorhizobium sp. Z1-4 TaxID=2448478 RepID=UPI000FDA07F6|nr:recombinase RecT [Mesorhizobium sp. Z1-4]